MIRSALACCVVLMCFGCTASQDAAEASGGESRDGFWSNDGKRILFVSNRSGFFQLYEMNSDGSGQRRLTRNEVPFFYPSYSPDGSMIVLMSYVDENTAAVWTLNADGSGLRRLTEEAGFNADPNWTADGRRIVFHSKAANGDGIFIMEADGSGRRPLTGPGSQD